MLGGTHAARLWCAAPSQATRVFGSAAAAYSGAGGLLVNVTQDTPYCWQVALQSADFLPVIGRMYNWYGEREGGAQVRIGSIMSGSSC